MLQATRPRREIKAGTSQNRPWPNDSENGPVRVVAQSRFRPKQSATATKPNAPNHYKGHYTLIVSRPNLITRDLARIHNLSVQRANAVLLQRKRDAGQNLPPVPLLKHAHMRQGVAHAQRLLLRDRENESAILAMLQLIAHQRPPHARNALPARQACFRQRYEP